MPGNFDENHVLVLMPFKTYVWLGPFIQKRTIWELEQPEVQALVVEPGKRVKELNEVKDQDGKWNQDSAIFQ